MNLLSGVTLLQIILLISTIGLFILVINARKHNKFRLFHVIFVSIGLGAIALLALKPWLLHDVGHFVGVEKGADFLVYMSIIILFSLVFGLLQYTIHQQQELTRFVSAQAIIGMTSTLPTIIERVEQYKERGQDAFLFLVRAYNEGQVIGPVIQEIIDAGFRKIVVCNDGSRDDTDLRVQELQRANPDTTLILISHAINRGPGAGNKTLFAFAKKYMKQLGCQRAVSYDADGQMDIGDMKQFMEYRDAKDIDIIFGSRFISGGQTTNLPWLRKCILLAARVITYLFNGVWLTDVSTGFRAYNLHALEHITLTSDRFSYQNDIIDSVRQHKLTFIEIPVHIKYTEYSLQKGQSNMSAFKILARLIYSSLFNR